MSIQIIQVTQNLLANNDEVARLNRLQFLDAGVLAVNLMASPGAGKTSLIVKTMEAVKGSASIGVIEGDIAGSIDAEKVLAAGALGAVQINTGGSCHLEAHMIRQALGKLDLARTDIVFIENVGNLVCPTHWALGEGIKLTLLSAAEGHDKAIKYPQIFMAADVIVLNKIDLIDFVDFDRAYFYESVRALNPHAPLFEVSCRTGAGLDEWADWLLGRKVAPVAEKAAEHGAPQSRG